MAIRLRKDFLLFASNDPLTINLDNDSDAIGLDSNMDLLEDVVRETNVSLYYGVTKQTLTSVSAKVYADASLQTEITACTCTCDVGTGNVKVTIPKGKYANSLYVNITASCSFGTRSTLFSIFTQVGGEPGVSPVIYQLAPSVTSLPFPRSEDGSIPDKTYDVLLQLKRTIGNHSELISHNDGTTMVVYYGYDHEGEMQTTPVGSSLSVTNANIGDHNSVDLELWNASKDAEGAHCIDRESLPITRDGKTGTNACRLDLDNENDSMLYSASGTLVSGNVTSTARLYFGTTLVTEGVEYSSDVHGCSADVTSNDDGSASVTVYGLSEMDAYVVVRATYRGHTYDARLTVKKLIGVDKYDMVVTPSAVSVNDTKQVVSADKITIQVYRTEQNGSRTLLHTLPDGYTLQCVYIDGGEHLNAVDYADGSGEIDTATTPVSYVFTLYDASGIVLDSETVPVNHCADGDNPDVWTIGIDGYWYLNGEKTDKKATGASGQSSFVSYMFCRSAGQPESSLTTEGSFGNPSPTHSLWKDAIPTGHDPVWMQSRLFTDDGLAPQQEKWSVPVLLADTSDVDICYHDAVEGGATPDAPLHHLQEDQGNGWRNTPTDSTEWMAVSNKTGGEWSPWAISKIKGETGAKGDTGASGQSSFVSYMFCRSTGQPESFLTTEGSFGNPSPTHSLWKDAIPTGHDPVWMQSRLFTDDGLAPQQEKWSAPVMLADTSDVDICYHDAVEGGSTPNAPLYHLQEDQGNGWRNTPTGSTEWMAVSNKTGGEWSPWAISKIKGETGAKGDTGASGQSSFVSYMFCRSAGQPESFLTTEGSFGNPSPTHSLWKDAIPTGYAPVWMQSRLFTDDGLAPQQEKWSAPVLLADTSDVDICYHDAVEVGATPDAPLHHLLEDQGNGWRNTSTDSTEWMAVSNKTGGEWSPWAITKIKGETGAKGDDSFVLDIDNEMTSFPVDEHGEAFKNLSVSFGLNAFYGTRDITSECIITCETTGTSYGIDMTNPSEPIVSLNQGSIPEEITDITFKAHHPTYGERYAVFSVAVVKAGGQGSDAVLNELLPSLNQVSFSRDADGKTLTPAQRRIEMKIKRTRGESVSILDLSKASGITVRFSFVSMPEQKGEGTEFPDSGLPVDSNTPYQNVYIAAFNTSGTPALPIDRETIPIIKDGSKGDSGTSPFLLDIDNEMTSIPLDENGYVSSAQTISFGMEAYYGIYRVLSECEVELENVALLPDGMTCDLSTPSSPVISISTDCTPAELTELTFKATHPEYGVRRAVFSIAAVRSGGQGEDAVLLELLPSNNQLVFQRDDNNELTPIKHVVNVQVKRTKGEQVSIKTISECGLTLRCSTAEMPATPTQGNHTSGTVTVTKNDTGTNLYLAAFNSAGTLVDRETIPIIRDGKKGDKGDAAINVNISTLNILAHKSASLQSFYVSINVKDGETPLPYDTSDASKGFFCSVLDSSSTVQGLLWKFEIPDENTFRYRLALRANDIVNATIPFTVTVRGVDYNYVLTFSTVDDGEPGDKGDKGDDGNGISEVNYYRMTTMTFEAPTVEDGGWIAVSSANCPKETDLNKEKRYLWQRKTTTYTYTQATHEVSLLAQYNSGVCANILEQTAFLGDGYMDKWNKAAGRVLSNAVGAQNGYLYTPVRTSAYVDVLQQLLYKHGEVQKLKPNTWYTLSFYAAMNAYENIISTVTWNGDGDNNYAFVSKGYSHAFLNPGQKMILNMKGYVADATKAFLRLWVWGLASNGTDWDRAAKIDIKSQSSTEVTLEFTNTDSVGRIYYFRPYAYTWKKDSGGNTVEVINTVDNNPNAGNASYRVYVESLTLDLGSKLNTYLYNNLGGDGVQHSAGAPWYVDGRRFVASGKLDDAGTSPLHDGTYVSFGSGANIRWQLKPGTQRHTFTFKTPTSMSTSAQYNVLFRWSCDAHNGWISMPKIEENTMATEWMEHSNDRMADDMQHIYVGEWKPSVEGNAATYYLYALGVRHCVRAKSSVNGDMTYFRLKKRTLNTGYCSLTQPYADTTMWERADYLRFVAADLLLANEVITDKLTVTKVMGKNENFVLDADGNVITKGTIYANAMYITPGAIKTVGGKKIIDLVDNPGNTYILPENGDVQLPNPTPFENITITIIFGYNSGISCDTNIYTPYYIQSSFNDVPNNNGMSVKCLFSEHYMNSLTLQATRPRVDSTDVDWCVVGQRGVLQIRDSFAGGKLYDLMPDGRLVGLPS